jgi:hypothetical protein
VTDHQPPAEPTGPNSLPYLSLADRIRLTYHYHGPWSLVYRGDLPAALHAARTSNPAGAAAAAWYRRSAAQIVIPTYRHRDRVAALVKRIRRTTDPDRVNIVIADDASGPEHLAALHRITGVSVIPGPVNSGFCPQREPRHRPRRSRSRRGHPQLRHTRPTRMARGPPARGDPYTRHRHCRGFHDLAGCAIKDVIAVSGGVRQRCERRRSGRRRTSGPRCKSHQGGSAR